LGGFLVAHGSQAGCEIVGVARVFRLADRFHRHIARMVYIRKFAGF